MALNDANLTTIVWHIVKTELITLSSLNEAQKQEKVEEEQKSIQQLNEETIALKTLLASSKNSSRKAYVAYEVDAISLSDYKEKAIVINKEIESINQRMLDVESKISLHQANIERYQRTDFTAEYFNGLEIILTNRKKF